MYGITYITIYCSAGNDYIIHIPVTMDNNKGYFPKIGAVTLERGERTLQMGFCVENEDVGELHDPNTDKVAITYKHKLPLTNTIWFYAATGERARIYVSHIQVHSHESIATGGPAYGTYFSDVDAVEET